MNNENEPRDDEPEQAVGASDEQHDKDEAPAPRDEFLLCDSPGSVVDENGNLPPLAE